MHIIQNQNSRKFEKMSELHQITSYYKQELLETFEFLKDSKDYLEFKKMANKIELSVYFVRLTSLMNMGIVYFYALYEAFIRNFFSRALYFEEGMRANEFNSRFHSFHAINEKVVKEKFNIYFFPKQIFKVLNGLRIARNQIVHLGKKAKTEFRIIEISHKAIMDLFLFIEKEVLLRIR